MFSIDSNQYLRAKAMICGGRKLITGELVIH